MKLEFIEVGRVVNAHGIRGDLKVHPIDCEAELIARSRTVYLNGAAFRPSHARVHKGCVLLHLPGVEDMDAALALKGQSLSIRRQDARRKGDVRRRAVQPAGRRAVAVLHLADQPVGAAEHFGGPFQFPPHLCGQGRQIHGTGF